ncbi:MAG: divalent-cation tolerance protein CutA [Campylobacter sp.]|nr:divalent-cation tolerance protein CutA [Campylobacter sp.]
MLIQTTTDDLNVAKNIAKSLLSNSLCACVQISKIESFYTWDGEIKNNSEHLLNIKTTASFERVENEILKLHNYKTPEIIGINLDKINQNYKFWLEKESK